MGEHTEGNWEARHYIDHDQGIPTSRVVVEETGVEIALIKWWGKEKQTMRADAHLIAAAPELLEACEGACEYYEMLERATGVEHGVLKELREAIAKAKGDEDE